MNDQHPLLKLSDIDLRILGSLLEKERTTPEYYPLTVKSLRSACNQRSSRDPVMQLEEIEVRNHVRVLVQEGWVELVPGARADRWAQRVTDHLHVGVGARAILTLLILRGPQTVGELRGRSDRMYEFESLDEAQEALDELAAAGLAQASPRGPGQKEVRWLLPGRAGTTPVYEPVAAPSVTPPKVANSDIESRLQRLEAEVAQLRERFDEWIDS